jgi:PAS domain S-box-containing protein
LTGYQSTNLDVTPLHDAEQQLKVEKANLAAVFQSSPVSMIVIDETTTIVMANRAFARVCGCSESDIVQRRLGDALRCANSLKDSRGCGHSAECSLCVARTSVEELIKNGGSLQGIEGQYELIRDGEPRKHWLKIGLEPFEMNGCRHWCVAMEDITERKRAEAESERLTVKLRQSEKMSAIGQLAGGVAHDFNNQLTGVLGYGEMLLSRLEDPNLRRYAQSICTAARRSADLTKKLLAFARQGQYKSEPVDIHGIIDEVVQLVNRSIDRRIGIRQLLSANPSVTNGDPGQLQNALLNLAINASDAMPNGGELVFETEVIELGPEFCDDIPDALPRGPYLRIIISDTGCGIPKENLQRIFEPFFTTKEVGKGTGMGLAAVYGTVKQHGGTITVYSEVGHGTTFRIYLPVDEKAVRLAGRGPEVTVAPRRATILLVDDEELVRLLAKDTLSELGYSVTVREDGESGLAYFRDHWREIDVVILDLVMPRMNGAAAYRAMKAINPDVKVLLCSGYTADGAARELLADGAQGFVQKPFHPAELSAKIAKLLQT